LGKYYQIFGSKNPNEYKFDETSDTIREWTYGRRASHEMGVNMRSVQPARRTSRRAEPIDEKASFVEPTNIHFSQK
jgi:hypothetical protein